MMVMTKDDYNDKEEAESVDVVMDLFFNVDFDFRDSMILGTRD